MTRRVRALGADERIPEDQPLQFWAQHTGNNTARYGFLVNGTERQSKTPADLVDMAGSPAITFDAPDGLPDGRHTWEIRALNDAGDFTTTGEQVLTVSQGLPALFGQVGYLIVTG